jgi:hypothetical protein
MKDENDAFEMLLTPNELSLVEKRSLSEIFNDIRAGLIPYIITDDGIRIKTCYRWKLPPQ